MGNSSSKDFQSVVPVNADGENVSKSKVAISKNATAPINEFGNVEHVNSCRHERSQDNSIHKLHSESFDFRLTEGQSRRNAMADCETECSQVTDYLFVGGHKVSLIIYKYSIISNYVIGML